MTRAGSFQAFYEDLNKLKTKFQETGPKFPERNQVLLEICERLIVKLAENIAHSNKQESQFSIKKLEKKVIDSEKSLLVAKRDAAAMQNAHEAKLAQMESERQASLTNEKFLEEKCRSLQEEKDRTEDNARKRISQMTEEFATKLREGREKLHASEEKRKRKEEDELRKMSELEKLNALIEQKLQLTENELSEFKTRLDTKERDLKELNKELHTSRKEIQGLNQKLYEAQNKKKEEMQEMRDTYEKRITEMQANLSVSQ